VLPLGRPKVCTFATGRRAWYFRLKSGTYLITMPGTADGIPGRQVGYVFARVSERKLKATEAVPYGVLPSRAPNEPDPALYQGNYRGFGAAVASLFAIAGGL
jgi:hypothetical protein